MTMYTIYIASYMYMYKHLVRLNAACPQIIIQRNGLTKFLQG